MSPRQAGCHGRKWSSLQSWSSWWGYRCCQRIRNTQLYHSTKRKPIVYLSVCYTVTLTSSDINMRCSQFWSLLSWLVWQQVFRRFKLSRWNPGWQQPNINLKLTHFQNNLLSIILHSQHLWQAATTTHLFKLAPPCTGASHPKLYSSATLTYTNVNEWTGLSLISRSVGKKLVKNIDSLWSHNFRLANQQSLPNTMNIHNKIAEWKEALCCIVHNQWSTQS